MTLTIKNEAEMKRVGDIMSSDRGMGRARDVFARHGDRTEMDRVHGMSAHSSRLHKGADIDGSWIREQPKPFKTFINGQRVQ